MACWARALAAQAERPVFESLAPTERARHGYMHTCNLHCCDRQTQEECWGVPANIPAPGSGGEILSHGRKAGSDRAGTLSHLLPSGCWCTHEHANPYSHSTHNTHTQAQMHTQSHTSTNAHTHTHMKVQIRENSRHSDLKELLISLAGVRVGYFRNPGQLITHHRLDHKPKEIGLLHNNYPFYWWWWKIHLFQLTGCNLRFQVKIILTHASEKCSVIQTQCDHYALRSIYYSALLTLPHTHAVPASPYILCSVLQLTPEDFCQAGQGHTSQQVSEPSASRTVPLCGFCLLWSFPRPMPLQLVPGHTATGPCPQTQSTSVTEAQTISATIALTSWQVTLPRSPADSIGLDTAHTSWNRCCRPMYSPHR